MTGDAGKGEYLIEFLQHGSSVKVSAIDPATMTEVSIVGPVSAGQAELARTAVKKLKFVLARKGEADGKAGGGPDGNPPPAGPGPGIVI